MIKSNTQDLQYLSYEKTTSNSSQVTRITALEKKEDLLWQSIRENVSEAKKQFKKLNEQLKEELSVKLKTKAEVVEEILRTLDSKIEFVIQSCEKYGNRIMQHVNGKATGGDDNTNIQAYNHKFQLITEKMRVLESRLFGFKQNQEQLKSRVEILKDKNNQLTEEYRLLSARSNERINQLEQQLREKEHQLRQKDHHLREKTDELRKKENNDAIKFTFVHPTPASQPPPAVIQTAQQIIHKTASQQSSGVAHYNPGTIIQQPTQPKKQNPQKAIPIMAMPPTEYKQSQPLVNNNSIQIRPDFFKTGGELNSTKGINLRSIRDDNLTSARKPIENQTTESQYRQRERERQRERGSRNEQHDHRFDYLMSNLVATQADSNTQMIDQSRVSSRMSSFQSSYIHR